MTVEEYQRVLTASMKSLQNVLNEGDKLGFEVRMDVYSHEHPQKFRIEGTVSVPVGQPRKSSR